MVGVHIFIQIHKSFSFSFTVVFSTVPPIVYCAFSFPCPVWRQKSTDIHLNKLYIIISNVVFSGACAGGLHVLRKPKGQIASKGALYKDDETCQWRVEVNIVKVRRCSICLRCKTIENQRQIRALVERNDSGVELQTLDYKNPGSNPGCGVKTLGKFFHSTLLQFTQLNK